MTKYLYCEASIWHYFVEYFNSQSQDYVLRLYTRPPPRSEEDTHVFCQTIPLAWKDAANAICFNTEQLTRKKWLDYLIGLRRMGVRLIDYSPENIAILKAATPEITSEILYEPYRYNPIEIDKLKNLIKITPKEYDFAFFGALSPYRLSVLKRLPFFKIYIINKWGDERDREIAKCKILLNIHYDQEYNVYESFRCDRWAFAGLPVLSEQSIKYRLLDCHKNGSVKFVPYINLAEEAIKMAGS